MGIQAFQQVRKGWYLSHDYEMQNTKKIPSPCYFPTQHIWSLPGYQNSNKIRKPLLNCTNTSVGILKYSLCCTQTNKNK